MRNREPGLGKSTPKMWLVITIVMAVVVLGHGWGVKRWWWEVWERREMVDRVREE